MVAVVSLSLFFLERIYGVSGGGRLPSVHFISPSSVVILQKRKQGKVLMLSPQADSCFAGAPRHRHSHSVRPHEGESERTWWWTSLSFPPCLL